MAEIVGFTDEASSHRVVKMPEMVRDLRPRRSSSKDFRWFKVDDDRFANAGRRASSLVPGESRKVHAARRWLVRQSGVVAYLRF